MNSTPITADLVRGAVELEQTSNGLLPHRIPAWARAQGNDPQLATAEAQPSGVRVVFRTRSTVIELVTAPTKLVYRGAPPRPDGVYDLYADGVLAGQRSVAGGTTVTIELATGAVTAEPGEPGAARFDGLSPTLKNVEIWLPYNEKTELVELRTDEPVEPAPASGRPLWLHHGSSISHGSNTASPSTTWPAIAAARGGYELTNLGLSGSALLDPFTARTMRDLPADLISVRAFGPAVHGFLDTLREGHPTTPLVVVSPIYCPIHEDTPGPGAFDPAALAEGRVSFIATGDPAERAAGKLTLNVIRDELARIVAERAKTDPQLSYLDGRELYGEADFALHPLPDQLHPDAATHLFMGERFADRVFA